MTDTRTLELQDFWRLKQVSDVQVAPDGRTIAYVLAGYDESHDKATSAIWVADLETGEARQFTSGEAADSQPRWSPDAKRLAFISTRHEDKPQVFVMPAGGGEARRLTEAKEGAGSPVWSPDSARICFSAQVESDRQKVRQEEEWLASHADVDKDGPRLRLQNSLGSRWDVRGYVDQRFHLFVIDADAAGAEPRQITDGDYDDLEHTWSPDGELIAFVSNRTAGAEFNFASDIWTVTPQGTDLRRLTDETSSTDINAPTPAWSPDGSTIAFYAAWPWNGETGFRHYDTHAFLVGRAGGDQRPLSMSFDLTRRAIQPDYGSPGDMGPLWSKDGRTVYLGVSDREDGAVYAVDVETGNARRLTPEGLDVASAQLTPDERLLICVAATSTQPYDIYAVPVAGGPAQKIVESNQELLAGVELVEPERVTFAGPDGWEIQALLYRPLGTAGDVPLILNVHGGPQGAWGSGFYFLAQTLARAGFASLYVNPRGSAGWGERFTRAADWGEKDFEDLLAGVDAALASGGLDPKRLGVTGISYGGFMTNWVIGHTDRFAAAVSGNGLSNLVSFFGVSDEGAVWLNETFGAFWESEELWQRYRYHSPISYVDRISTPLLLIQSENDYRCPIEQGEQMLSALRMRRQTVELVRFPGASHAIIATSPPHHRYLQFQLVQDWFDTYLKGEPHELEAVENEEPGVTAQPSPVP